MSIPQNIVNTGATPFRIVPNETERMLSAIFEKPISRAVAMPIGRTYSRNCLRVKGCGRQMGRREKRKAQIVVSVLEKVVTVRGNRK